ncbi:MAG: peptide-methionine (S)-S-oxide reductase, partial [Nitrososphaeraceae archaeon]
MERDVCSDKTGHAEEVQVDIDPNEVYYENLVDV